jgi:hypothetical protein
MFDRLLRWLGIRKKAQQSPNPFPPSDPRHEAFEALWTYAEARRKKSRRSDDSSPKPGELVLREMPNDLLQESQDLLKEYREQWSKAAPEPRERDTIFLLPKKEGKGLRQEAEQAAAEIEREMRRRGKDARHYYSIGERSGTGEVDRTYDTESAKPLEGLGDEEQGDGKP